MTITKKEALRLIAIIGGRELVVSGYVMLAIHPPFSPSRRGGLVENPNRKTGWKVYAYPKGWFSAEKGAI